MDRPGLLPLLFYVNRLVLIKIDSPEVSVRLPVRDSFTEQYWQEAPTFIWILSFSVKLSKESIKLFYFISKIPFLNVKSLLDARLFIVF